MLDPIRGVLAPLLALCCESWCTGGDFGGLCATNLGLVRMPIGTSVGTPAREHASPSSWLEMDAWAALAFVFYTQPCTMAPLRRYLRITKHSVLEVRIYLDRPSDGEAWLLKRDDAALPRVIQAVRPLVLPKLREENGRGKGRGGARAKKKGVKDVVIQDDFEVSIFLTELSCRHSVLSKQKIFKDRARIQSNSGKLTSWLTTTTATGTIDEPVVINEDIAPPIVIREEDGDEPADLSNIPEAKSVEKQRSHWSNGESLDMSISGAEITKAGASNAGHDSGDGPRADDKKKLGLNTSYDGFSIYGRILCLVVKRRGGRKPTSAASSQAILETWVSTQAVKDHVDDDEDAV